MEENRRAEPEVSGGGTGKRSPTFSMIETFIGESKKGDGFRSDETCRSGLSSIVHDEVFMFRKDKREIEVKRSRCGEDGG